MTWEVQVGKYFASGVVIALGDRIVALRAQKKLGDTEIKKDYVKSMDFISAYRQKDFEKDLNEPDFSEHFSKAREYFQVYKKEHPTIDDAVQSSNPGIIGRAKNAISYTKDYFKKEKINNLKFTTKLVYSFMVPLTMDIWYMVGGAAFGTEAPKTAVAEFGETLVEAPGLVLGLTAGKYLSKVIGTGSARADKKLRRLEDKILSNEFLKEQIYKDFHPIETIVEEKSVVEEVQVEQSIEKPKAETAEERSKRIQDLRKNH